MTFYNEELNIDPAFGWQGGPTIDVRIKRLRNRHERRNRPVDDFLHEFSLPFKNVTDHAHLSYLKPAFMALGGPTDTFPVKDYLDFTHGIGADDSPMQFGVGDGVTSGFQLSKTYRHGDAQYARPLTKPQPGHVILVDDTPSLVTADPLTGWVDFGTSPPDEGAILAWLGEFRVVVRFAEFSMAPSIDNRFGGGGRYATNLVCSLIEVLGE
jgi:uncharacterized protein (TIGR02217 family)